MYVYTGPYIYTHTYSVRKIAIAEILNESFPTDASDQYCIDGKNAQKLPISLTISIWVTV